METSSYTGAPMVGGNIDFPSFVFTNQPVNVIAGQFNTMGNDVTVITLTGSVSQQVTGNYIDGTNRNYPGAF